MQTASDATTAMPAAQPSGVLVTIDRYLGKTVEVVSAILVAAEILVLFAGVVMRYLFHAPLIWSDEVATIGFVWLTMLGAVIALRRGQHMRMTALVSHLPPDKRAFLEALATGVSLAFLILIMMPAWEYAIEEIIVITPALEISVFWRAASIPVGVTLMLVTALLRLALVAPRTKMTLFGLLAIALIVIAFSMASPLLIPLGKLNLVIFFVGIVAAGVFSGVPIAFSFALATFGYLALTTNTPMTTMVGRLEEGMSHMMLLAVPLFVFLGMLIEMTGMAKAMVQFLGSLLGHVRGGLSYVLIGAMYLVSGISGSKTADQAAVAPVLFPEMLKRGAKRGDLVALLSVTGAQTETIPPSIVLITIGSVTGVSIAALFTGGLVPGAVLGIALCFVVWWRNRNEDLSGVKRYGKREIGRLFLVALPALVLPFLIRAAVIEGVATATEVSTLGVAYSIVIGLLFYRKFDWKRAWEMLIETASLAGAIIFIIGAATSMAWGLTQSGFSHDLATFMSKMGGPAGFIAISVVAFIILGSVLEGIPSIVLFGPLLFPIAREIGVHEVHYAMVVILAMGIGLFAPPFGVGYYGCCAVSKTDPDEGIPYIWAYLAAAVIGLIVVAAFPWFSIGFL
jgi:TRAP transporter, DctM subunit